MDSKVRGGADEDDGQGRAESIALVERTEARMRHAVRQAVARVAGEAVADELVADVYREPASQQMTPYEQSLLVRAQRGRSTR